LQRNERGINPIRRHGVLREVIRPDADKVEPGCEFSDRQRRSGNFDHDADRRGVRGRVSLATRREVGANCSNERKKIVNFCAHRNHWGHDPQNSRRRRRGAKRPRHLRREQRAEVWSILDHRKPIAAHAEERIRFVWEAQVWDLFVTANIRESQRQRPARTKYLKDFGERARLLSLIWWSFTIQQQKLRSKEADALCTNCNRTCCIFCGADVCVEMNSTTATEHHRPSTELSASRRICCTFLLSRFRGGEIATTWRKFQRPSCAVKDRLNAIKRSIHLKITRRHNARDSSGARQDHGMRGA
jgi:hypothetical protein